MFLHPCTWMFLLFCVRFWINGGFSDWHFRNSVLSHSWALKGLVSGKPYLNLNGKKGKQEPCRWRSEGSLDVL